jgi:hypothetical protein
MTILQVMELAVLLLLARFVQSHGVDIGNRASDVSISGMAVHSSIEFYVQYTHDTLG